MVKTIQIHILRRYMSESDLKSFMDDYKNNLYRHHKVKAPNEKDVKVASLFKKSHSYAEVSKLLGIPSSQVHASIGRVYAHKK